jgi:hypothetical protein
LPTAATHPTSSQFWRDVLVAGGCAAVLSGIPSTLHAWLTGGDVMEATRAAGAMLIPARSSDVALIAAATIVHCAISLFWASVLVWLLPRRHLIVASILALAAIAVLDLRIIGPLFPEIYALPFWPQFADHVAWGAAFGVALNWRLERLARPRQDAARSASRARGTP